MSDYFDLYMKASEALNICQDEIVKLEQELTQAKARIQELERAEWVDSEEFNSILGEYYTGWSSSTSVQDYIRIQIRCTTGTNFQTQDTRAPYGESKETD